MRLSESGSGLGRAPQRGDSDRPGGLRTDSSCPEETDALNFPEPPSLTGLTQELLLCRYVSDESVPE